tara:strand:- start:15 stop:536 length:522 start_codon:yes stop_codon:yes gene_type:complete
MTKELTNSKHSTNSETKQEKKSKNTITPLLNPSSLTEQNLNTIEEQLVRGLTLSEILDQKQYQFSLMKFYHFLKRNPKLESRIIEARKLGVQTLIDKMLQIFQHQEIENPNQILWVRERTKFIQYLAGHLTDLYSNNKVQNIKSDTNLKVSWEEPSELIDVSTVETVPTPPKE